MPEGRNDDATADEDGGEGDGGDEMMTQDEKWQSRYTEVKSFIEMKKRNPSRHRIEEHDHLNWLKANRKVLNAGKMKEERVEKFRRLLELGEKYKHVNQYV